MNQSLPAPAAYPLSHRAVLVSLALGGMLVPLNSTMIPIALPDVMAAFGSDMQTVGWLVTAYLITMAALQLVAGKLGDQFGRRRFVLGGLVYFGLSSLLAASSPGLPVLLFARVQQAIAGSILITNGIPLAFEITPENRRGSDLGVVNAVFVLAAAAGPPLGGLLVGLASWQAIFWVNIPIVIAALLFGWSAISEIKPQHSRSHFDWLEIPSLFRSQTFVCANGAILFSNLAMYVMLLAIPVLMSARIGWSSLQTGLILAAMSGTIAVFTPIGGRLSDRIGRRKPSIAGIALLLIGVVPLAVLGEKINIPLIIACLWLMGTGLGLSSVSLQTSVLGSVKLQQAGLVTGISSTSRYVGSIVGSSMLAQIIGPSPFEISDFRNVFLMVTISACIALLLSWGIHSKRFTK
ncbi:MAG TPA: MFS transporter [Anaerolineales bacterium]